MTPKMVLELLDGTYVGMSLTEPDQALLRFLCEQGHTGDGREARALQDPACLPMLVAARINMLILYLSQARDRVTDSSFVNLTLPVVAYSFNADVFFNPREPDNPDFHPVYRNEFYFEYRRGYEKAFPTCAEDALQVSRYLDDILFWLEKLQIPS